MVFLLFVVVFSILMTPAAPSGLPPPPPPQPHHLCQLVQRTALCSHGALSSAPSDLPDDLEELQLNHNAIRTLAERSLARYPSLQTLSLAANHLEALESRAFAGSPRIECLNLAENSLHVGYQETGLALRSLPRLRVLDLSRNELDDEAASDLLQNLTSLETLDLSWNVLLRLDETSFLRGLRQLRELDLQGNMLFEIDGAFDGGVLPRLRRLNLAFNFLPCLTDFHMTQLVLLNASHNAIEWFVARQDPAMARFRLETLDLSDNRLLFFPFLPSRSRLRNLHLSRNAIRFYEHLADPNATAETATTHHNWTTSVRYYNLRGNVTNVTAALWDEGLHGDLSSLDVLELSGNQIDYFPRGFVAKMPSLSTLRVATNCLEGVLRLLDASGHFSDGLLRELDVSDNRLREVEVALTAADRGGVLGNLTYLNLSLNALRSLPSGLLSSLPSLLSVDLSYNPELGGRLFCPDEDGEDVASDDCVAWGNASSSLTRLYLRGCGVARLPSAAFAGLSLTHLDLSDNAGIDLGEPPRGAIRALSGTLRHLGLGSTGGAALLRPSFDFSPFRKLEYLDLSNNSLARFPASLVANTAAGGLGLRLLRVLDLRDNGLTTIPSAHADALAPTLRRVFLSGNPFNCCRMEWSETFARTETLSVVDVADVVCEDLFGRTHRALDLDRLPPLACGRGGEEGESVLWYFLLVVPVFMSFLGISVIFCLTFKPRLLLRKTIKKKCFKATSY